MKKIEGMFRKKKGEGLLAVGNLIACELVIGFLFEGRLGLTFDSLMLVYNQEKARVFTAVM